MNCQKTLHYWIDITLYPHYNGVSGVDHHGEVRVHLYKYVQEFILPEYGGIWMNLIFYCFRLWEIARIHKLTYVNYRGTPDRKTRRSLQDVWRKWCDVA